MVPNAPIRLMILMIVDSPDEYSLALRFDLIVKLQARVSRDVMDQEEDQDRVE